MTTFMSHGCGALGESRQFRRWSPHDLVLGAADVYRRRLRRREMGGDTIGGRISIHHIHGTKEDAVSHDSGLQDVALTQMDSFAQE